MKLNLIYNVKSKINTKWWKIKMKTNNLTQISLWNDPINRRMQGFSFRIFEDESGVQDLISSNSFDQTMNLNIQWKRKWVASTLKEMVHEMVEYTRRIWRKSTGKFFRGEELYLKRRKWILAVGWSNWSWSTVVIARPLVNRHLLLMAIRFLINSRDLISSRVWEEASISIVRWILIQRSRCDDVSTYFKRSQPL